MNDIPVYYGIVNGLDAISYQELCNEEKMQPGVTVAEVIAVIDRFKSCPMQPPGGFIVIEGSETREGTIWDQHALRQALTPKTKDAEGK